MILYITILNASDEVERIGITPPSDVDSSTHTVYKYNWDEQSDIPLEPSGDIYQGFISDTNYHEDGVVHLRTTGETKLYVNGKLIPFPDDYKKYIKEYYGGKLVNTIKVQ